MQKSSASRKTLWTVALVPYGIFYRPALTCATSSAFFLLLSPPPLRRSLSLSFSLTLSCSLFLPCSSFPLLCSSFAENVYSLSSSPLAFSLLPLYFDKRPVLPFSIYFIIEGKIRLARFNNNRNEFPKCQE